MPLFRRRFEASTAADRGHRARGQSFVEFALVLPVILLLAMVTLDFGRVYLGWINLQNMVRAAANYAANNSTAWLTNDTATITKYQNQVVNDAAASNCQLNPSTPVAPSFTDTNGDGITTGIGDNATVNLTCKFQVITPMISNVLGGTVNVSSSAVFPVKTGITGGSNISCILPIPAIDATPTSGLAPLVVTFTDASGGAAGVSWLWDFGDGTPTSTLRNPGAHTYAIEGPYTATLSVTNACGTVTTNPGVTITVGSVVNQCRVPTLDGLVRSTAQAAWAAAKFTTTVQDAPNVPKNNNSWTIKKQSIVAGSEVDCGSTIIVDNNP